MLISIQTFQGFNELDSLIAPVSESEIFFDRAMENIAPYLV